MAVRVLAKVTLVGGATGYEFEVVRKDKEDDETYRAALEIEQSLQETQKAKEDSR